MCPFDPANDEDSDGVCDVVVCAEPRAEDVSWCAGFVLDGSRDCVAEGACDACSCACADQCRDHCPLDPENDADSDSLCNATDSCPYDADNDWDSDTICGDVDSCPWNPENPTLCDNSVPYSPYGTGRAVSDDILIIILVVVALVVVLTIVTIVVVCCCCPQCRSGDRGNGGKVRGVLPSLCCVL